MQPSQESHTGAPAGHRSGYLPTLDGWRAVAIVCVVLAHDRVWHAGRASTDWFHYAGGMRAVELFFALSGLLICTRLLEEERLRGNIHVRGFYLRRICRIQPPAWLFLAAVGALMLTGVLDRLPRDWIFSLLMIRNYNHIHWASPDTYYLFHFWSLSVEEQFYLLFPAFLLIVRSWRRRVAVLLCALVLMETMRELYTRFPRLHFGEMHELHTEMAAGPIALGAVCAILLTRPAIRRAALRWAKPSLVLPLALAVQIFITLYSGRFNHVLLVITLPAVLASTLLHPRTWTGRLLESAPLRFLGRISYSLYLWQMLLFPYGSDIRPPRWRVLATVQHTPLRYAVLLALGTASFFLIERPMMRLGHRLAKPATPGREDLDTDALARAPR